jgi:hypothetical protein
LQQHHALAVKHPLPTTATGPPLARDTTPLPVNLPTVSEILDRYVAALGGAEVLQKITTRIEKASQFSEPSHHRSKSSPPRRSNPSSATSRKAIASPP